MRAVLATLAIAFAPPAFAECAAGYTQITVPLCAPVTGGVTAIPANTFLSSLGVQTHIDQGYPEAAYEPEFTYTGIRNARDATGSYQAYITLHNNTKSSTYPGVKMAIGGANPPSGEITPGLALDAAGALMAFEGPNEPNNFPFVYNGNTGGDRGTWVPVAQFQADLYTAIKGNSTLAKYPVFNVSEDGGETDNVGLQCNALNSSCPGASAVTLMPAGTVYADYANPHNYVQGGGSCATAAPNQAWNAEDPLLDSCWDGMQTEYVHTWAGNFAGYSAAGVANVPRVTSETGWDSSTSTTDYQGKVLVNTYLDGYKRGWAYTFIYEMVDEQGSTGDQGLFDTNNVAKPAATFIHNMTTILQDTTNFTPGQLNYSIANEPATVHDMLLQKSNGTFYLAIWDEQTSTSTTDNITVTLGTPVTVTEYDTTVGTTPVATFTNATSIPLTLSDHAVFLAIP